MNRRKFLQRLGIGTAAIVVAPKALLSKPEKVIVEATPSATPPIKPGKGLLAHLNSQPPQEFQFVTGSEGMDILKKSILINNKGIEKETFLIKTQPPGERKKSDFGKAWRRRNGSK